MVTVPDAVGRATEETAFRLGWRNAPPRHVDRGHLVTPSSPDPSPAGSRRRRWVADSWRTDAPEPAQAWIIDSFLVDSGRVHDAAAHLRRFIDSCDQAGLGVDHDRLHGFWEAARAATPADGRWFPRLEAHRGSPAPLVFWLRPAPPRGASVRLWFPPHPDPRRHPRLKGPDHVALAALREEAVRAGADDAVLVDDRGRLLETAHSALVWWRGDTLYVPDPGLSILPSVTAAGLRAIAGRTGSDARPGVLQRADVGSVEVWTVNALHGIRPVTAWCDAFGVTPAPAPDAERVARFEAALVNAMTRFTSAPAGPSTSHEPTETAAEEDSCAPS